MAILRPAALATAIAYLAWRLAFTWSGAHPVLFAALLLAEAFGVFRLWIELRMTGSPQPIDSNPDTIDPPPTDVCVVVDDQPASEARAAIVSALGVQGVASVMVVDRMDRSDIRDLTNRLGTERITGTSDHGDVGELLTDWLLATSAPLVAVVPADHVVLPDLVATTAMAFEDPEIGVVLARTEATNARHHVDIGGYGARAHRDAIETPALDGAHALPWWHGVAIARREALEEIGGFASGRHQATLATGVRLQVGGWRMADVPVIVARQLAPATESRGLHRWSRELHERLALARRADHPWSSTRITPMMRLAYTSAAVPALRGLQYLLLIIVLLATAFGAGLPLVAPGAIFLAAWSARVGLGLAARWHATRSIGFTPWVTADVLLFPIDLAVVGRVLRKQGLQEDLVDAAPGSRLRDPILLGLQVAAVAVLAWSIVFDIGQGALVRTIVVASGAWVFGSVTHARSSLRLRQSRRDYRAVASPPIRASDDKDTWIVGATTLGVEVVASEQLFDGAIQELTFALPRSDGSSERIKVGTAVRQSSATTTGHTGFLRFSLMTDDQMDRVIEYCAVVSAQHSLRSSDDAPASESDEVVPAETDDFPGMDAESDDEELSSVEEWIRTLAAPEDEEMDPVFDRPEGNFRDFSDINPPLQFSPPPQQPTQTPTHAPTQPSARILRP